MSWEGFKKAINRTGGAILVKDTDKTTDKDYDIEERRYRTLEKAGLKLHTETKGYLDSLRAVTAAQVSIAQIISNLYEDTTSGGSIYARSGKEYLQCLEEFDAETMKQLDGPFRETVLEPVAKFVGYFGEVNEAIKKRANKKTDYDQCKAKVRRLVDKPAKDASKLPRAEKELAMAKEIYEDLNLQLKTEMPQLISLRVPYYDASFEALVKIQLRFCTEGYTRLAQIQQFLDQQSRDDYISGQLDGMIDQLLGQMNGLQICSIAK